MFPTTGQRPFVKRPEALRSSTRYLYLVKAPPDSRSWLRTWSKISPQESRHVDLFLGNSQLDLHKTLTFKIKILVFLKETLCLEKESL